MGKVVLDVSMSLDGYIAQPDDDPGVLHEWVFRDADTRPATRGDSVFADDPVLLEGFESLGAVLLGRRTFDLAEEPWGDDPPFQVPVIVLTHRPHETLVKGATTFTFVTEGLDVALSAARDAAGDKDVSVMGADTARQVLAAGQLDEMRIHLISVLFGEGVRLFEPFDTGHVELDLTRVIEAPDVTHMWFALHR